MSDNKKSNKIVNNDRIVIVKAKSAYGKDFFYPVNPTATRLVEFARCETLMKDQLKSLKKLGYTIRVELDMDLEGIT